MIEYSFAAEIAESDKEVVLNSRIYTDWLAASEKKFKVTKVHFASVDFLRKGRQPLFIKLEAAAFLPDGRPVHGIVLVRGNAVGVLIVLRCEGKPYLLLVRQPRFAISEQDSLEIPAGILDWTGDYRKVALSELEEEAQIKADDSELIDLMDFWYKGKSEGFAASCGLLDERIRLYAIEREVTPEQLKAMDGKDQQYTEEIEWIRTEVLPYEEAAHQFIDGKNFIAMFLYERWLKSQGREV
ncbi:NUDIX domain-containing protein [Fibrobacter sp. UWH1]|uniref:NUDIX domain-containing protein n=1 Tax=Fibrobacter sp. UWH1 TaxID=1964354 RepID=UPI000B52766E|nr:NUDIX domain-containing protein [Fibrobacter sp. UWH1]OWV12789.1 NUDIX hydrolase [Fibrobacter sp. UWH1]